MFSHKSALGALIPAILLLFPPTTVAQSPESSAGSSAYVRVYTTDLPPDLRSRQLESYLASLGSPLVPEASNFISIADKYGLDWRLLPAISGVESTFGKRFPVGSFNPFGWGIYGDKVLRFRSFRESMEAVAKGIKEKYPRQAQSDFRLLGRIYNGVTPTEWSNKIRFFVSKLAQHSPPIRTSDLTFSL